MPIVIKAQQLQLQSFRHLCSKKARMKCWTMAKRLLDLEPRKHSDCVCLCSYWAHAKRLVYYPSAC